MGRQAVVTKTDLQHQLKVGFLVALWHVRHFKGSLDIFRVALTLMMISDDSERWCTWRAKFMEDFFSSLVLYLVLTRLA